MCYLVTYSRILEADTNISQHKSALTDSRVLPYLQDFHCYQNISRKIVSMHFVCVANKYIDFVLCSDTTIDNTFCALLGVSSAVQSLQHSGRNQLVKTHHSLQSLYLLCILHFWINSAQRKSMLGFRNVAPKHSINGFGPE